MSKTLWQGRERPSATEEADRVLELLRQMKCHLRPGEVASLTGMHRIRAGRALRELERRKLVRVAFWGLTERGKR